MSKQKRAGLVCLLSIPLMADSYAQFQNTGESQGPVGIPGFYPNVELVAQYDDNVLRTENNEQDSFIALIKPDLLWRGRVRKHEVNFGYRGEIARYEAISTENYEDHNLFANATLDLSRKFDVLLDAGYTRGHVGRGDSGVGAGVGTNATPDLFDRYEAGVQAIYGRRSAKAQIGAEVRYSTQDYTNNNQQVRDSDATTYRVLFYYNIGPKTRLIVEPSYQDFVYPNSNLDNQVSKILVGVGWDATAKTSGEFKIGWQDKNFDDPTLNGDSGLALDASITWRPKSYSTFNLGLSRDIRDASGFTGAESFVSSSAQLTWNHELTRLTLLEAGVSYTVDDYNDGREDDVYGANIGVSYALRRWLSVGVRADYDQRDSTLAGNSFDDKRISVGLKTTF